MFLRLWIVPLAAFAGACATLVPPAEVKLAPARATRPLPAVSDLRPAEARLYRETNAPAAISKFVGDDVLQPQLTVLLQHQMADALPAGRERARIELRQADVG